ncbi:ATP-binding cassette domain-containing protein [Actinocorallia sp. A-T 12471]|uniref:ATP-binding cassette domain-containing protein n=1 Tax=Actinocorallia sp. A-T 12471 TaxID=3089813 RepID=UPI0029CB2913|nr:ATP-binding cassette domain-containing protein [Actinocorallia sp. A-T 12471]MDX6741185.1 ATP-binding cassette domain-containing protein [Actinocorallia sp. A-T 12471]
MRSTDAHPHRDPVETGGAGGGTGSNGARGREVVEIKGLTKRFGRATVLDDVDLTIEPGEIHALVGQNGSGKSTLIKILSGVYTADAGRISVAGHRLATPVRPADLREHSLAFVHQDLGLVDDLTVVENVRVGQYTPGRLSRKIDWARERRLAEETFARLNAEIPLDARLGALPAGQRAVVAIARAVQGQRPGSGCVVFDESTQSLPRETLPEFYAILRSIARSGTGILIVSHRLEEVMSLADRVTVLRDGAAAATGVAVSDLTEAELSRLILGRELAGGRIAADPGATAGGETPDVAFEAVGVSGRTLQGLDLRVHRGEVIGITGAGDCGLDEVAAIVGGTSSACAGRITVGDAAFEVPVTDAAALHGAGLAVIPQNRMADGLAAEVSAIANLTLPRVRRRGRAFLSRGWQHEEFKEAVATFGITPAEPHAPAAAFSGGNQQKLLLSKWLLNAPRVLVACEPTQAVDVGARLDILRALRAAADAGKAVVICSIEVQDLAVVCDRVVVLRAGRDPVELGGEVTADAITEATYA